LKSRPCNGFDQDSDVWERVSGRNGIRPAPVNERHAREVRERVILALEERAKKLSKKLSHISDEEVASLIREDRERG